MWINQAPGETPKDEFCLLVSSKPSAVPSGALTTADPLHDALPESAAWAEPRARYFNLIGEVLPEPPSFQKFLEQLKPSRTGQIWCPSCQRYKHDEFEPYDYYVASHYKNYHLSPELKFVDPSQWKSRINILVKCLLERSESQATMLDLIKECDQRSSQHAQEQQAVLEAARNAKIYNKAKLPNVPYFLFSLSVSCDGRLLCRHKHCNDSEKFDATLEAIRLHFFDAHCVPLGITSNSKDISTLQTDVEEELSLGNIGLLLEPLFEKAAERRKTWKMLTPLQRSKKERVEERRSLRVGSLHDYVRKKRQWQVLQELRAEFASRNRHLLDLIKSSGSAGLKSLSKQYKSSTDLLNTGILTFKDILSGGLPSSLKEVFAFINLSYSAASVMTARGTPNPFSPSAGDFITWREAVPVYERPIYEELALLMARDLTFLPFPCQLRLEGSSPPEIYFPKFYWSLSAETTTIREAFHDFAANMLKGFNHSEDFNFSSFDNILYSHPGTQDHAKSDAFIKISCSETPEASMDAASQDGLFQILQPPDSSGFSQDEASPDTGQYPDVLTLPTCLKTTIFFSIVFIFLNCEFENALF